ncbi:MAG: hypothetical protein QM722_01345 [Piscinibacter sp.]
MAGFLAWGGVAPAAAQNANPGLVGIDRMRMAMGLLASETNRRACNITAELEQAMVRRLRIGPSGIGVSIPEQMRIVQPSPGHNVHVAQPNDRALPLFFVSVSALAVTVGQTTICSYSVMAKVDVRVSGQSGATGRTMDQEVGVWFFDRLYSGTPDTFAADLSASMETVGQELAAAVRNAAPGKQR